MLNLKEYLLEASSDGLYKKVTIKWRKNSNIFIRNDQDAFDLSIKMIKSSFKNFYGDYLIMVNAHPVFNTYKPSELKKMIAELKEYMDGDVDTSIPPQSNARMLIDKLFSQAGIILSKRGNSELIRKGHNYVETKKINTIEIHDVESVEIIDGEIVYMDKKENLHTLDPKHTIIRKCKREKNANNNTVVYIDKSIEDMQEESGLSRPEAAWYAKEYDADYAHVSGISVKRWMNLPPEKRVLAGKIEDNERY
jgi:hypothetical protein